ncbi:putative ferric reductase transmembrane component [Spathaspora sp. JA1]|nr:putative ferric reductase transmembrane component [Spathaspora sp. JA1]
MRLSFATIFYGFLLSYVIAKEAPADKSLSKAKSMFACRMIVHHTITQCPPGPDHHDCICNDPDAVTTFVACYAFYQKNATEAVEFFSHYCSEFADTTVSMNNVTSAYANYTTTGHFIIDGNQVNFTNIRFNDTNPDYAHALEHSINQFLHNWTDTLYYGNAVLGYWGLVMVIGALVNWLPLMFPQYCKPTGPFANWCRRNIILPATIGKKRMQNYKIWYIIEFYMPSRFESIILLGFCVVVTIILTINMCYSQSDSLIFTDYQAHLRYLANRTGIISTMMLPLVILFAGRNNILQYVTRWNHSVFICFHRYIARMMFIFVLIHGISFAIALGPDYHALMRSPFMIWGTVATVCGGIMIFQGLLYFRRRWYEMFLAIHILMAALFIAGTWRHVVTLGYVWYVYAATGVWVLDRIIRIVRIIAFGFPESDVTLMSNETLKVVIEKPKYWQPTPGGHVFIHFLRPSCFWQSHPFTCASAPGSDDHIVLYCKIKGGVTHGLYQYLMTMPEKTAKIRVGVEGPYGETSGARTSETAVFMAGGNGIPGMYSEAVDLAINSSFESRRIVKLYWVIREYRSLHWFFEELQSLRCLGVETTVFVTQPDNEQDTDDLKARISTIQALKHQELLEKKDATTEFTLEEDYNDFKNKIAFQLSHVNFIEGRPNINQLVQNEIEMANKSVAFVTCGHPAMVDDIRHEVVKSLDKTDGKRVDFYEQLLSWA